VMGFTPKLTQKDDHFKVIALTFSHIQKCFSSHPHSRKCQVRVRFAEHSRTVGPQNWSFFMPLFWRLEFGSGA